MAFDPIEVTAATLRCRKHKVLAVKPEGSDGPAKIRFRTKDGREGEVIVPPVPPEGPTRKWIDAVSYAIWDAEKDAGEAEAG